MPDMAMMVAFSSRQSDRRCGVILLVDSMVSIWTQLSRTVGRSLDASPRQPGMGYRLRYSAFDMRRWSVTGTTRIYMVGYSDLLSTILTEPSTPEYCTELIMGSGLHLLSFFSYFTCSHQGEQCALPTCNPLERHSFHLSLIHI